MIINRIDDRYGTSLLTVDKSVDPDTLAGLTIVRSVRFGGDTDTRDESGIGFFVEPCSFCHI